MPTHLTPEWFEEYLLLGAALPERPGATARIRYVITVAEAVDQARERIYHVAFEDGRIVAAALGDDLAADVTLTMSERDAVAVQSGELDANTAFSDGRIRFDGDMRALMSLMPVLWPSPTRRLGAAARYRAFQDDVRAMTNYRPTAP